MIKQQNPDQTAVLYFFEIPLTDNTDSTLTSLWAYNGEYFLPGHALNVSKSLYVKTNSLSRC